MATITRENIGLLTDKLTVTVGKNDYFARFEQSLKKYAKTANIPGFRKGMVPAGLVKKMYGQSVFTDEVLRTVETELNTYLNNEKLEIFAQPLPLDNDARALDVNNPSDYVFAFEIGLKPAININTNGIKVTKYEIEITDAMIDEEVNRLQVRNGKMTEPESLETEEHVLNVKFVEADAKGNAVEGGINKDNSLLVKYFAEGFRKNLIGKKKDDVVTLQLSKAFDDKELEVILSDLGLTKEDADKHFNLQITKVGLVEKAPLEEALFLATYPNKEIKTAEEFRNEVKAEIARYYESQSRNQIHDQIYHHLIDHTTIELPEAFLKRWLQTGGEKPKTAEEAEQEFPTFANQLKWTLISSQLIADNKIDVNPDDIKAFARQQLFSYMGGQILDENQPWIEDYVNRMMQDRKFVEDTYHRVSTDKLFSTLETQVNASPEKISAEAFAEKLHHHHH